MQFSFISWILEKSQYFKMFGKNFQSLKEKITMKKKLPDRYPEFNYYDLPYLPVRWEIVKTALILGIFDNLREPCTTSEIAGKLSLDPKNTMFLLNALTALGMLNKKNKMFSNTKDTDLFLTSHSETGLGSFLLSCDEWNRPVLNDRMINLIKNGPSSDTDMVSENLWAENTRKTVNFSRCGRAQKIASMLSRISSFFEWKKILDLGAGSGVIGIALAQANENLECFLYDKKAVIDVAKEVVCEYLMEDRVKTICGDYEKDEIGSGYDAIIASYTFNFFKDDQKLGKILTKCLDSLNPGGYLIVFSDSLTNENTSPEKTVLS